MVSESALSVLKRKSNVCGFSVDTKSLCAITIRREAS